MIEEMCKYMMSQTNCKVSSSLTGYPELLEKMCKYMMSQTNCQESISLLGYPEMLEEMCKYKVSDKLSCKFQFTRKS